MHPQFNRIGIRIVEPEITGSERAPDIIFVHGAGGEFSVWNAQRDYFRGHYLTYLMELPGHGGAGGSGEEEIPAYARRVRIAIEDVLTSNPCVLVGHSMGGAIVLELAANPPRMVNGIALVATGAKLGVVPAVFRMIRDDPETFFKTIEGTAFGALCPGEIRERLTQPIRECPPSVILKDLRACDRFDIRDRLKEILLPTLIVCGEEDLLTPLKYSEYLKENIIDSRLKVISQAGHMVMAEQPQLLNRALESFLDEIRAQLRLAPQSSSFRGSGTST